MGFFICKSLYFGMMEWRDSGMMEYWNVAGWRLVFVKLKFRTRKHDERSDFEAGV